MDSSRITRALGFRIRNAHLRIQKEFAANFQDTGLTPLTLCVLLLIADNPNCRQVELAEALKVHQTNLVSWLDSLAERGLVARVPDAQDGRVNLLSLTRQSRKMISDLEARAARFRAAIEAHLGAEQYQALSEILMVLCEWE
jgi:DNA-binding MarR family transcriptional regulator